MPEDHNQPQTLLARKIAGGRDTPEGMKKFMGQVKKSSPSRKP
jgi:hypothetical protein